MHKLSPVLLSSSLLLLACDTDDVADDAEIIEPTFGGKFEDFGNVGEPVDIAFGGEVSDVFEKDFQFFVYSFDARENAEVTVEVTHLGSSQGLDTILFLYFMPEGEEPRRIAFDDDDGFAALSELTEFRLFNEGRYAAVVGTKGSTGRGKFRLTLTCDSDECAPELPPEPACPGAMQDRFFDCLHEVVASSGFEIGLDEATSELCGTPDELEINRIGLCSLNGEPEWCSGDQVITDCGAFGSSTYPSTARAFEVLTASDDEAFAELLEAGNSSDKCGDLGDDAGCEFKGGMFTHDPAQTLSLEELLGHGRSLTSAGPGSFHEQTLDDTTRDGLDNFTSFFGVQGDLETLVESLDLDLDDAQVAHATGPQFQFAFGDCEGDMVVVHFPAAGIVLHLNATTCFG